MAVESNLLQRGFSELKISEQAFAVAMRYKKLFDEKKLAAIDEELISLEKSQYPVGTENKLADKLSVTAAEYGLGRTTIVRLVRINELTDNLKALVDSGNIRIRPAVELSYLSIGVQKMLYECMSRTGINTISQNTAWELKELCKNQKDITPGMMEQILNGSNALSVRMDRSNRIALDREVFERYFKDVPKKEVVDIVQKALEMYFNAEGA
ncbi:MAG: hypothetical protein J6N70_07700 [Oribacterium sp.]|nr:hypothetical protein [Oribacterium sp.]MBP1533704.1 hypothetical protein [Ruminococcus sp.]